MLSSKYSPLGLENFVIIANAKPEDKNYLLSESERESSLSIEDICTDDYLYLNNNVILIS